MNRRELFRRSLLGTLGAATGSISPAGGAHPHPPREFPADFNYAENLARSDWKPEFLSEHQNETLIVLGDLIIPETDTSGAKAALANRFIDHLLAAETPQVQKEFLGSLAYIDGECRQRYGSAFVHLPRERQDEFLTFIAYPHRLVTWGDNQSEFAGHEHFSRIKNWISQAYYSSEIGMKELGWDESPFHGPYTGCRHPEGTHKPDGE
ncbi:MAG: gluconate 2-dehydrogenase subunit 3 family protein [Acidobacteriota bacterium]